MSNIPLLHSAATLFTISDQYCDKAHMKHPAVWHGIAWHNLMVSPNAVGALKTERKHWLESVMLVVP